jgi:gentisate 1,2-dioxygenase
MTTQEENAMTTTSEADDPELRKLYDQFATAHMVPLWTQLDKLMPDRPTPVATPYVWRWNELYPLAQRSGDLVPVGRGGERRAIARPTPAWAASPSSPPPCGRPFATHSFETRRIAISVVTPWAGHRRTIYVN